MYALASLSIRLDLHVDIAGLAAAHGVEVKLARARVAANGAPGTSTTNLALSSAEARKKLLHAASLATQIYAADWLHFSCCNNVQVLSCQDGFMASTVFHGRGTFETRYDESRLFL